MVTSGSAAVGFARVWHRRNAPAAHEFSYDINQIWLDPDRPHDLCDHHRLWSSARPSPIRFKRSDYFDDGTEPIGPQVRAMLAAVLGRVPVGPVRMLTQPRTWGWLFNPITVYLVWDGEDRPAGAVLEVTNTPWKERHRYPLALAQSGTDLVARFDKALHVSPFLGMDFRYEFRLADRDDRIVLDIDVIDADGDVALTTGLRTGREAATHDNLDRSLRSTLPPTHRVSAGIHFQAARLWRKGVPFVSHPKKTSPEASS